MARNLNKEIIYRTAKPKEKDYPIKDGDGLRMLVQANGVKVWHFIFKLPGRPQQKRSFGIYPAVSLEKARRKAEEARSYIAKGLEPPSERKAKGKAIKDAKRLKAGLPIENSFADITVKWLQSISHLNQPQTHKKKVSRLERLALPFIGQMAMNEIKSSHVWAAIKPLVDTNKLETAHRLHAEIDSIFNYAIVHDLADYNPAQAVAKQIPALNVTHRAAIVAPSKLGQLLRDIWGYQGTFVVQTAFKLSILLFQRPGEIRQMLWADIDVSAREWRPHITKTDFEHIVPLPAQAVALLESIKPLTGNGVYVFSSSRGDGRPMSENTIRAALLTLGYDSGTQTAHGFRTIASTFLNEQGWSPDAIERQLAHMPRDNVRKAYNRAHYLDERKKMMQAWADYLDVLKKGDNVIPLRRDFALSGN